MSTLHLTLKNYFLFEFVIYITLWRNMHMCVVNCFMSCPTLCNHMDCTTHRLLCPWDSLGKDTGVSCHALLQGIFLTQIQPLSLVSPALAGVFFTHSSTWEAHGRLYCSSMPAHMFANLTYHNIERIWYSSSHSHCQQIFIICPLHACCCSGQ